MGLPTVGFQETGGCDDLIMRHGEIVPRANTEAAAAAIDTLLKRRADERRKAAEDRRSEIRHNHLFDDYCYSLLANEPPKISVVLPNYNYAHCLEDRLVSIFNQSHPVFEVIVLDDASTDDSIEVINRVAEQTGRTIELVVNEKNTGSPFKQWEARQARRQPNKARRTALVPRPI